MRGLLANRSGESQDLTFRENRFTSPTRSVPGSDLNRKSGGFATIETAADRHVRIAVQSNTIDVASDSVQRIDAVSSVENSAVLFEGIRLRSAVTSPDTGFWLLAFEDWELPRAIHGRRFRFASSQ